MNKDLYFGRKRFYRNYMKKYKTNKSRLKFLEQMLFLVEMVDHWGEFEEVSYEALKDLIKEVKSWER